MPAGRAVIREQIEDVYATTMGVSFDYAEQHAKDSSELWTFTNQHASSPRNLLLYANHQRLYGLALFTTCYINGLLQHFDSDTGRREMLAAEADFMAAEVISVAEETDRFRPMGSGCMIMSLGAAWIATADRALRARLEDIWDRYAHDLPDIRDLPTTVAMHPPAYESWKESRS